MIIVFFTVFFLVFSFQFFDLNMTIQGLNRAIISTPIEIMYRDVYPSGNNPSFTTENIQKHLEDYYKKSLSKYVKEYTSEYYFYNQEDESMCVEKYCSGLEVTIKAKLSLNYRYQRVMYYELGDAING